MGRDQDNKQQKKQKLRDGLPIASAGFFPEMDAEMEFSFVTEYLNIPGVLGGYDVALVRESKI